MLNLLAPLLAPIVNKLVDRIPDPNARAEAAESIEKEILGAVQTANAAQTKINEAEAKHTSVFVAGWRPFVGWVCGAALANNFILIPYVSGVEALDLTVMLPVLLGMLGLGGLRTYEKTQGVARTALTLSKEEK